MKILIIVVLLAVMWGALAVLAPENKMKEQTEAGTVAMFVLVGAAGALLAVFASFF